MTLEEKRVKLAEALGWKFHGYINDRLYMWPPIGGDAETPPNWPEDLNACHEAVQQLDADQFAIFAKTLGRLHPTFCISVLDDRDEIQDGLWEMSSLINADAGLRFNTLGITLGLWKEGE